jgi:hypothetical protein
MDQLTIMRRANGELFTITIKGREHLAVWPSLNGALRYKTRNPELLVFVPALVTSPFGQKSLAPLRKENMELFFLTDTGSSRLRDGRKMSWQELEESLPASSPAAVVDPTRVDPKPGGVDPARMMFGLERDSGPLHGEV